MRLTMLATLAAVVLGGALLLPAGPADAQARKRQSDDMFFYTAQQREYRHRPRPRVVIRQRSYLDPGPELIPGEYKYREYAEPYGYSAIDTVLPIGQGWNRRPFNDPWDVPGKPWPGRVDWW
jgi:hypothetical protein